MPDSATYRFGVFRFDASRLDLRRDGQSVRLQRQPAQVLALLVERAGRLVTRDELRRAVWGDDTFVDFERGLNFCVAQLRAALGDDAAHPRYVRTVPKSGYEFICPVAIETGEAVDAEPAPAPPARRPQTVAWLAAACALVAIAAVAVVNHFRGASSARLIVAVARFDNETGDPGMLPFSDALTDNLVEQLTLAGASAGYEVVGNAAILRAERGQRDLRAIAASLHASYVVLGQVQRDSEHVRVLGHLIRLPDQTHVTVARFDDVADQTLARTHDIAAKMSERFTRRLASAGAGATRLASPVRVSRWQRLASRLTCFWSPTARDWLVG